MRSPLSHNGCFDLPRRNIICEGERAAWGRKWTRSLRAGSSRSLQMRSIVGRFRKAVVRFDCTNDI